MTLSTVQEKSRIDLAAMSERECFQKEQEVSQKDPTAATTCVRQSVSKDSCDKKDQSSKVQRHRPYPIDAATCTAPVKAKRRRPYPIDAATCAKPVVIDAEERVEAPLIDAATMSVSRKESHDDIRANSDDELTSVSDVPEMSAEEILLREAGMNDPS